jgi:hypothetical protein
MTLLRRSFSVCAVVCVCCTGPAYADRATPFPRLVSRQSPAWLAAGRGLWWTETGLSKPGDAVPPQRSAPPAPGQPADPAAPTSGSQPPPALAQPAGPGTPRNGSQAGHPTPPARDNQPGHPAPPTGGSHAGQPEPPTESGHPSHPGTPTDGGHAPAPAPPSSARTHPARPESGGPVSPAPPAGAGATAPAPPKVGRSAVEGLVSGTVLVRRPGATASQPLTASQNIPLGAVVDATHGVVKVTSALDTTGTSQSATVWGGRFVMTQTPGSGLTTFKILGAPACGVNQVGAQAAHRGSASRAVRTHAPVHLWSKDDHGRYSTRGRNSVATVRGTEWETIENCSGTRTIVRRGLVSVRDLHRHLSVLVHAGHSYLARR